MFKPVNIFTAAALGAGILAMHQAQAAPLRTRSTSKIFMLAQYNSGDKAFFTVPHGESMTEHNIHVQDGFDPSERSFELKPYAADDSTKISLEWVDGFSWASLDDGTRASTAPLETIAQTSDGVVACTFPITEEPAGADYMFKLYCIPIDTANVPQNLVPSAGPSHPAGR